MAPMIDVVFLLLCFFVTTQIFSQWESEINITLPTARTGESPQRLPGEIIINIQEDGGTSVNQRRLSQPELATLLHELAGLYPGQPVLIRADKRAAYEYVVRVLDLCRQADIWNIAFATSMPET
jgi:biopolymer transport protein ExbD